MSTTINKNLGHVTAYAYAKAGGYTGTEAQFQALLGNIAIDLSEIENLTVVVNTLPAGSSATSSYSDGVLTLGIPRGDTGEVSDADLAEALEDYVEKTTLDDYAQVDGYYSDMTVGDAEQLISSMYVEDGEPYGYRTTGGSADVGNREYIDAIVGGSLVWNQLVPIGIRSDGRDGITMTPNGDGSITIDGTATARNSVNVVNSISTPVGHVFFVSGYKKVNNNTGFVGFAGFNTDKGNGGIWKNSTTYNELNLRLDFFSGDTFDNVKMIPQAVNLTQMFGSTIADYIYSLEQANAGAGVAFFRKLFPKDYYEYNAGELISVSGLQSHDMVGFNMWDEEWESGVYDVNSYGKNANANRIRCKTPIKVLPNTSYYVYVGSNVSLRVIEYDSNMNILTYDFRRNSTFTTTANTQFITIHTGENTYGTTYKGDICINLSWSGWRNGEYESYEKHSYPLDSSLILRGIPKLDAQNNLYFDGDEYKSDGSVTRRYGIVDLGTLTWSVSDGMFEAVIGDRANGEGICTRYIFYGTKYYTDIKNNMSDKQFGFTTTSSRRFIEVRDSAYTDATAFKTAMNGVMLVYELETPTTETAESYQGIQICDDFGTEEFVSTSIVPVGHNTRYPANLRDKLQHLPNLADNDGAYLIRQTNKQMSLEVFRIPKAPTTDGVYTLKATVSGGTPTYTWEAEE